MGPIGDTLDAAASPTPTMGGSSIEVHAEAENRIEVVVSPARPGWYVRVRLNGLTLYDNRLLGRGEAEWLGQVVFSNTVPDHVCTENCRRFGEGGSHSRVV